MPQKNIAITAAEGQTGHLIADLLLIDEEFRSKIGKLLCLTMNASHPHCESLKEQGAEIVPMKHGAVAKTLTALKAAQINTLCLIPPAVDDKLVLAKEMLIVAKKAGINSIVLISSAGGEFATTEQKRLKEFLDIEHLVMSAGSDPEFPSVISYCIIRPSIYAETILLYNAQAKNSGKLPLPLGDKNRYAPVALGDVAQMAAIVLTGEGHKGLDDRHRGQLMLATGPMLLSGKDIAEVAGQVLDVKLEYEDIQESEARKLLDAQADLGLAEKDYLIEYYQLVRAGGTNYISTTAFRDLVSKEPTEPTEFFTLYEGEFKPKRRKVTK